MPKRASYQTGKYVVILLALAKLIDTPFSMASDIIVTSKHFRFNVVALAVLGFLSVVTNYLMIPRLGINGASAATVISILIYNFVVYLFFLMKFKMQPFSWRLLFIPFIGFVTLQSVSMLIAADVSGVAFFMRILLMMVVYGGLSFVCKISPAMNRFVVGLLKRG